MANTIKLRRATGSQWSSVNPVLNEGEAGVNLTTGQIKIGDGTTAWNSLGYVIETVTGAQAKADAAQTAAGNDATSKVSTHAGLTATHGVSGAIVGTTETQTLANKTIDGNSNTLTVLNAQTTATSSATGSTIVLRDSSGDTAVNQVTLGSDPSTAMHAVTKQYADNLSAGINAHGSVVAATTANLSATYTAGSSDQSQGTGVGATLTASANGVLNIDGYASAIVGDRVLVKDQTTLTQNGIYTVTNTGSVSTPWVLTRATDFDNSVAGEVYPGDFTFVRNGTLNAEQGWVMNEAGSATTPIKGIRIGTDSIVWTQFTGVGRITVSAPITKSGNTLSITAATTSAAGSMSAADKTKIDALEMPISFHISGTLSTGVKQPRFISPVACTLVNARAYAGGGSGVTYRLVKNGSTTGNTSATVGAAVVTTSLSTVTSLAAGDVLQIEIVSAGTSGADLSVTIEATY